MGVKVEMECLTPTQAEDIMAESVTEVLEAWATRHTIKDTKLAIQICLTYDPIKEALCD